MFSLPEKTARILSLTDWSLSRRPKSHTTPWNRLAQVIESDLLHIAKYKLAPNIENISNLQSINDNEI